MKIDQIFPLKNNNLLLRLTVIDDASVLCKTDVNEDVQRFLGGIKNTSLENRKKFIYNKISNSEQNGKYMISVVLNETEKTIGFLGLNINLKNELKAEISYLFDYDFWGRGFCSSALKMLIDELFSKTTINYLVAEINHENLKSINVIQKLGFKMYYYDVNSGMKYYSLYRNME